MKLKDENLDTVWGYYRDGTHLGNMDVNFDRGTTFTLGERKTSGDSAWSHFKGLSFMVAGHSTFSNFSDLDPGPDTDPDYNCRHITETEQKVTRDAKTCTD